MGGKQKPHPWQSSAHPQSLLKPHPTLNTGCFQGTPAVVRKAGCYHITQVREKAPGGATWLVTQLLLPCLATETGSSEMTPCRGTVL